MPTIGYKKCLDETKTKFVLVELEIPETATWFTPALVNEQGSLGAAWNAIFLKNNLDWNKNVNPTKSRADSAKVTKIHGGGKVAYSLHSPEFEYKVGETVKPDVFDPIGDYACSSGIHFFKNKEDAVKYSSGNLYNFSPDFEITDAIVDTE